MTGVHSQVIGHLVRRGVQAVSNIPISKEHDTPGHEEPKPVDKVKAWEVVVVCMTIIAFSIFYFLISYTIGEVVASLAAIEQPRTILPADAHPLALDSDHDDTLPKPTRDEELAFAQTKPVTTSIRKTVRLLQDVGGFRARFRGMGNWLVYSVAHTIVFNSIGAIFDAFLPSGIAMVVSLLGTAVLLSCLHMSWTHAMVATSSRSFLKRLMFSKDAFKKLALPSLACAIARVLQLGVGYVMLEAFKPLKIDHEGMDPIELLRVGLPITTVLLLLWIGLTLPLSIALTRIEASLLRDDDETLVNFDRTLNGLTENAKPWNVMRAAFASIDVTSRNRLIHLYVKLVGILFSIYFAATFVCYLELKMIGGERIMQTIADLILPHDRT